MKFNLQYLLLPLSIMVCISGNYINAMDDNMEYNTQQIMNDFNVFKNENEDMYCFGVEEYKVVIDDNTGECYSYNVSRGDNMRLEIKKWNNNIFLYWNHTLIDKFNNMQNKNILEEFNNNGNDQNTNLLDFNVQTSNDLKSQDLLSNIFVSMLWRLSLDAFLLFSEFFIYLLMIFWYYGFSTENQ